MKQIGSLDLRGQAKVKDAPTEPTHVMRKQDVEALVSGTAPVYIVDVTPTSAGIVADKNYVANTVPANQLLADCVANTYNVRVHILAEGGSAFYSPEVDVNGTTVVLTEHATDKRLFEGYADLVLSENGVLTATSSTGADATSNITFLVGGPVVPSLVIDSIPGVQTHVKHNDVIQFSGTVRNDAVSMAVKNLQSAKSGSVSLGAVDSAGAGFRTFTGTAVTSNEATNNVGAFAVTATNSLGTEGDLKYSPIGGLLVDQTLPGFTGFVLTYPGIQTAASNTQQVSVALSVQNSDGVAYSFDDGTIAGDSNVIEPSKVVTVTSTSNNLTDNYHVTATRANNGSSAVFEGDIRVVNTTQRPTISVLGNPARLRSSDAGITHTIRLTSPDVLVNPGLTAPAGGGTFTGSWVSSNGGKEWRRGLIVDDADTVGVHNFVNVSFSGENAQSTFLPLTASHPDREYEIGGMTFRNLVVPAFSQVVALGSNVGNINKCSARYAGADDLLALRNDTNNVAKAFTISDAGGVYDPNGGYLFINDAAFAGSNTSGTLVIEFEEIV